jgi:predicted lactoylglutathione lyase
MIHHLGIFASDFAASRLFGATDRACVDAFFAAAVAAGGSERHAPRHWPEYRAYCAFVSDPDGNNIEAVCKET